MSMGVDQMLRGGGTRILSRKTWMDAGASSTR